MPEPLTPDALREASTPGAQDDPLYILVLAVPALLMLGGVMFYAMRQELRADARHAPPPGFARTPPRHQVRAPSRSIKPAQPLRPQRAGRPR